MLQQALYHIKPILAACKMGMLEMPYYLFPHFQYVGDVFLVYIRSPNICCEAYVTVGSKELFNVCRDMVVELR